MKMTARHKLTGGVLAALALVAVTVVAATVPGPGAPATATTPCAGQCSDCVKTCADCPTAATPPCAEAQGCSGGGCAAEACATVDAARCIGCGKCVAVAPEAYRMNPQTGRAEIKPGAPADAIARGARVCPVKAVNQ